MGIEGLSLCGGPRIFVFQLRFLVIVNRRDSIRKSLRALDLLRVGSSHVASQVSCAHLLVALRALGGEVLAARLAVFEISGIRNLHLLSTLVCDLID